MAPTGACQIASVSDEMMPYGIYTDFSFFEVVVLMGLSLFVLLYMIYVWCSSICEGDGTQAKLEFHDNKIKDGMDTEKVIFEERKEVSTSIN